MKLVLVVWVLIGVLTINFMGCSFALLETRPQKHSAYVVFDSPLANRFEVEIADTPYKRAQGLMERTTLAPEHGMLFMFDHQGQHSLWMKNTYISLDMIFFDDDFHVVGVIEHATPLSLERLSVHRDSRYVLEVLAGSIKKYLIDTTSKARLVYE